MAEQLVYKPHVLLASPSFDLYPFPIWNNKCKNLLYMWCFGAFITEEPVYKPGESLLQSSVTVDSLKEQHGPYRANRSQIYQRQGPQETIGIQGCPYFFARYRRCQETQQVQSLHSYSPWDPSLCVRPNSTQFFGVIPNLKPIFGFKWVGFGPQVLKTG